MKVLDQVDSDANVEIKSMPLLIGCALAALACSHALPATSAAVSTLVGGQLAAPPQPAPLPPLPPPDPALVGVDNAELIERLRRIIPEVITSSAQDIEHGKVAAEVSRRGLFVGRSEREIMDMLGKVHFYACTYERYCLLEGAVRALSIDIGQLPPMSVGGTPVLVIRLDRHDICTGTHLLHGE